MTTMHTTNKHNKNLLTLPSKLRNFFSILNGRRENARPKFGIIARIWQSQTKCQMKFDIVLGVQSTRSNSTLHSSSFNMANNLELTEPNHHYHTLLAWMQRCQCLIFAFLFPPNIQLHKRCGSLTSNRYHLRSALNIRANHKTQALAQLEFLHCVWKVLFFFSGYHVTNHCLRGHSCTRAQNDFLFAEQNNFHKTSNAKQYLFMAKLFRKKRKKEPKNENMKGKQNLSFARAKCNIA